jgi:cytoskeletal protein RodZ
MKELGKHLAEERIQRQLTLKDISARTQVSVKMLQHLEEGNCEQIGTPLLIRSFLRAYCSTLEIDPEPLIERYNSEILACGEVEERRQIFKEMTHKSPKKRRAALFIALTVIVFALAGWLVESWVSKRNAHLYSVPQPLATDNSSHDELLSELSKRDSQTQKPEANAGGAVDSSSGQAVDAPSATIEPSTASSEAPNQPSQELMSQHSSLTSLTGSAEGDGATPMEEASQPVPDGKRHLVAIADRETWIQVRVDGKHTYKALMKPGESREWEAQESMYVVVGNAAGARLTWDGQPLNYPAKSGRVLRLRLPEISKNEKEAGVASRP